MLSPAPAPDTSANPSTSAREADRDAVLDAAALVARYLADGPAALDALAKELDAIRADGARTRLGGSTFTELCQRYHQANELAGQLGVGHAQALVELRYATALLKAVAKRLASPAAPPAPEEPAT